MRIISVGNYNAMSFHTARLISAQVLLKPDCVLGLATGSSPVGAYQQMISDCKDGLLDFSQVRSVNLDEYMGLEPTHDQSYRYFMKDNFFDHINILPENTHVPSGIAGNGGEECARYDALISSLGGVDLQLLGIGGNGHIGFNEPGEAFSCGTHIVELTAKTREDNQRFFESLEKVPTHAITTGTRDIMQAKCVVMMASGAGKADAVRDAFFGPITPKVPASILQLHPNFVLVADMAAMSKVER